MKLYGPTAVSVMWQLPVPPLSVAMQVLAPSPTVTVPVGVPLPGTTAPTATLMVIGWPTTNEDATFVMLVLVASLPTVTATTASVAEEASFESPT